MIYRGIYRGSIRSDYVCNRWYRESAILIQVGGCKFGFRVGIPAHEGPRRELRVHLGRFEYIWSWGEK